MINSTRALPKEIWSLILDDCSDLCSLISLSNVNKQIRKLALEKLKKIKINANELYTSFYKIQDMYTIKYQNMNGPGIDITNIGKYILLEIEVENELILCKELKAIDNDLIDLENNQIIIVPNFGNKKIREFLSENNPNSYSRFGFAFGLGLESQAYSIAQDRLPIKKITIRSQVHNPHHLIAIKLAGDKVNSQFYKLNGSYLDSLKILLSSEQIST